MSTNDPWMEHLEKYKLRELHDEAELVGYRIRVATDYKFHLEYQGGLEKYYQSGLAVKIFENTDAGKEEARAFLATVSAYITQWQRLEQIGELLRSDLEPHEEGKLLHEALDLCKTLELDDTWRTYKHQLEQLQQREIQRKKEGEST